MIGLGVFVGLAAAASAVLDAQRYASPFDQLSDPDPASQGFDPLLVPAGALGATDAAPALPWPTSDSVAGWPTSARADALSTALPRYDPALGEGPPPTPTPLPLWIPDQIVIPAIQLDAPVVPATLIEVATWGKQYQQWVAPDVKAAGWHTTSATLGVAGNTVLNGHHNVRGEVFGHLADLEVGDLIWVYAGARSFGYRIVLTTTLPERWQTVDVRLANAQWMQPSDDERLTLVTCWPYTSNTHRLIIVATPVNLAAIEDYTLTPRLTPHPPAGP